MTTNNHHVALSMGAIAVTAVQHHIPLTTVTIVPCNQALGFVQSERKPVETNADLERQLQMTLAGWTAEGLFADAGQMPTGHTSDLRRAQSLAERIKANGDPREPLSIVTDARDAVRRLLIENEAKVRRIAEVLAQEGTLTGHQVQQIIGGC